MQIKKQHIKNSIFLFFFTSGFCGLLYQIIWLRLAYASFGVNSQVISVVVSVFMLGLALGSWVSGRFLIPQAAKSKVAVIYLYAAAEIGIGVGAFLVPKFFDAGRVWLLTFGTTDSFSYLSLAAVAIAISLLPWSFLMGTTIPLIVEFINSQVTKDRGVFSFLYLANTAGAIFGAIASAFVLIELLGLHGSLVVAAVLNFTIGVCSIVVAEAISKHSFVTELSVDTKMTKVEEPVSDWERKIALPLLFTTGLASLGLEVVWVRLFTPVLLTSVYAFAFVLVLYLIGTTFGLLHYRRHLKRGNTYSVTKLLAYLSLSSLAVIVLNDPRLGLLVIGIAVTITWFSFIAGYLTPKIIDSISQGEARAVGSAYAVNILGSIMGPLVAAYLLIPLVGAKYAIVILCLPIVAFLLYGISQQSNSRRAHRVVSIATAGAVVLIALSVTYEDGIPYPNKVVLRDYNATVTALGESSNYFSKRLLVNGVGMTHPTPITKNMVHLPLAVLDGAAEKTLVIAFGMGTSFRSSLSWDVDTTAVELTPSVVESFPYFFPEAEEIMSNEKAHVVIDDGRRYLQRTDSMYDLIVIDPPPPVEAAGSSLLYSKEFYEIIQTHLSEGGIFQQWYPGQPGPTLNAVARSLVEVFPYIKVYRSVEGWGYHFLVSNQPIREIAPEEFIAALPPQAKVDLMEWNEAYGYDQNLLRYAEFILSKEVDIETVLSDDERRVVTDDQPYNEYFLLRTLAGEQ